MDFINTNSHPIALRQSDTRDDLRTFGPGPFSASGRLADEAENCPGVFKANSDEGKRAAKGEQVTSSNDPQTPGMDRVNAAADAAAAAVRLALTGNSDRYKGDGSGGVVRTPAGTPAVNLPNVPTLSTADGTITPPDEDALDAELDAAAADVDYDKVFKNRAQALEACKSRGIAVTSKTTKTEAIDALKAYDAEHDGPGAVAEAAQLAPAAEAPPESGVLTSDKVPAAE